MIIFGIDPGTAITGYGIIRTNNNSVSWVDSGIVNTQPSLHLAKRLENIYDTLLAKMQQHQPARVCIEEAFYGKNIHTTLVLGHSRGVAMLAAQKSSAVIAEYSPREIKKAITGNGNAGKEQVAYMVQMLIAPPEKHQRTDAYDALAVALCDFQMNRASEFVKTTTM